MKEKLLFTNLVEDALDKVVADINPAGVFVMADTNTARVALPQLLQLCDSLQEAKVITVDAGDEAKNIEAAIRAWEALIDGGATRKSLLVNVGGGVVTDLGGFVAATFKRGMPCVNVPTTLLGAVDASVGGKTGINLDGYKNLVGVFSEPVATIISTTFFNTLEPQEMLSGYAEMIKHALLSGPHDLTLVLNYDITADDYDPDRLLNLLRKSVGVKTGIVTQDPHEKGLRKSLNLGHTIGHAFESLALARKSPIPHGYAVAAGIVAETILSSMKEGFDSNLLHTLSQYIKTHYPSYPFTCDDYPVLLRYMTQDKKNDAPDRINFTLLRAPGDPVLNVTCTPAEITAALDVYRDIMGI